MGRADWFLAGLLLVLGIFYLTFGTICYRVIRSERAVRLAADPGAIGDSGLASDMATP